MSNQTTLQLRQHGAFTITEPPLVADYCHRGPVTLYQPGAMEQVLMEMSCRVALTITRDEATDTYCLHVNGLTIIPKNTRTHLVRFADAVKLRPVPGRPELLEAGTEITVGFTWLPKTYAVVSWPWLTIYLDGHRQGRTLEIRPITSCYESLLEPHAFELDNLDKKEWELYSWLVERAYPCAVDQDLLILSIRRLAEQFKARPEQIKAALRRLEAAGLIHCRPGSTQGTICLFAFCGGAVSVH